MSKIILVFAVALVSLGVVACKKDLSVKDTESIRYLTASELEELFSGNTVYGENLKYNKKVNISYYADGTYSGTVANGQKEVAGFWLHTEDGEHCVVSILHDGSSCSKIYKEEDQYIFVSGKKKWAEIGLKRNIHKKKPFDFKNKKLDLKYLPASELKMLLSGHTIYGTNLDSKKKIEVKYNIDGTYFGKVNNGEKKIYGNWMVMPDGKKCNFSSVNNYSYCMKFVKEGGRYIGVNNEKRMIDVRFK